MKHQLPTLPYAYNALEPYISEEIMILHHQKHHAGYVNNLNTALEPYSELFDMTAQDLLKNLDDVPEAIRTTVKNNAGGHVNHSLFWEIMKPFDTAEGKPGNELLKAIEARFGSFEEFKTKFNDAGAKRFGSGWVWLVRNRERELEIMSTANQDNPVSEGHQVIMGNDVWEHAYYLQYKNVRADYLKAWWNVVNWEEVEKRFTN